MPTITHSIVGGAIGLLLYTITAQYKNEGVLSTNSRRKFKKEHVIVFALNCFVGPDFSKLLSPFFSGNYWESPVYQAINSTIHSIIGWLVISPAFALLYYVIFRFTCQGKREEKSPISFLNVWLLIVAGGLNHFGIDMLDYGAHLYPGFFPTSRLLVLEDFFTGYSLAEGPLWQGFSWVDSKFYLLMGLGFMVLLIWMLNKKSLKTVWITAMIFGGIVYSLIYLVGSNSVSNENDLGLLVYLLFSWIGPIGLCVISMDH